MGFVKIQNFRKESSKFANFLGNNPIHAQRYLHKYCEKLISAHCIST